MSILNLTDAAIRNLKGQHRATYFDRSLRGFGLRIGASGTKTFVIVHGSERHRRWETIGRYPLVSLAAARKEAADRLAAIRLGLRDDSTTTLSEAFDTFKRTHTAKNRISTSKETERLIERHLITRLGDTPLAGITTTEIAGIIDKLHKTPGTAFHLFAAARLFFRWAVKRRLLGRSPIDGLPAPSAPQSRDRVLSSAELTTVFRASDDGSIFGAIIRLLILSGQRRSQIAALRGEYIDRDKRIITWPASAMKANQPHAIPITPMITGVLRDLPREGYVFPARGKETPFNGFSKSKQSFDKKLEGVNPYVIHDLRRSVASGLQSLGVPIAHTEALLAHRSGSFAGIVAVYQRHSYLPEMKAALEAWETHLSSLLKSE